MVLGKILMTREPRQETKTFLSVLTPVLYRFLTTPTPAPPQIPNLLHTLLPTAPLRGTMLPVPIHPPD